MAVCLSVSNVSMHRYEARCMIARHTPENDFTEIVESIWSTRSTNWLIVVDHQMAFYIPPSLSISPSSPIQMHVEKQLIFGYRLIALSIVLVGHRGAAAGKTHFFSAGRHTVRLSSSIRAPGDGFKERNYNNLILNSYFLSSRVARVICIKCGGGGGCKKQ